VYLELYSNKIGGYKVEGKLHGGYANKRRLNITGLERLNLSNIHGEEELVPQMAVQICEQGLASMNQYTNAHVYRCMDPALSSLRTNAAVTYTCGSGCWWTRI
jgi:hypothetical protein